MRFEKIDLAMLEYAYERLSSAGLILLNEDVLRQRADPEIEQKAAKIRAERTVTEDETL